MIDVANVIDAFAAKHLELYEKKRQLGEHIGNEKEFWQEIDTMDGTSFYDSRIFSLLADFLQLVNDEERITRYELKDVERMYRLLVKFYPENIEYRTELILFIYEVMDDKEEAISLIDELKEYLNKQNELMTNLLKEINE